MRLDVESKKTITTAAAYYVSGEVPGNNSYRPSSIRVLSDRDDSLLAEFNKTLLGESIKVHR
ncbi:MAG TPA: hypothetical protein VGB55_11005 [Tepidisphaeraceae bacterium]|jgi:hypothetical protein